MENICDKNMCCGCEACKNMCPKKAISMEEDSMGVKYPKINSELCINCAICKKVCPQINNTKKNNVIECYASKRKSAAKRLDSASGGVANAIYEYFLENNNNGVVFGVEFDKQCHAKYNKVENIQDLGKFKGSKYVQAEVGNLYYDIIDSLIIGKPVLVIGTPCQLSALYKIIELRKISTNKLITIDLICHGVSPQKYLDENIKEIMNKNKWDKINKLTFRSNRKFRNFHFCIEAEKKGKKILYNRYANEDLYYWGYLKGITLRENCYSCKYANYNRVSDITIGDFIGLGTHNEFPKFDGNPVNMSIILCNTSKGEKLISKLTDKLILVERSLEEALVDGVSLKKPFAKHVLRNEFIENYPKLGFIKTMNKISIGKIEDISKKEKILRPFKLCLAKVIDRKIENDEE